MDHLPFIYYSLKMIFFGFILYFIIHSVFIRVKVKMRESAALVVIGGISLLYMLSDSLNSFFNLIVPDPGCRAFFLISRELVPLLFFFFVPFYINRIMGLEKNLKKTNRIFLLSGTIIALVIAATSLLYPDLLLKFAAGADNKLVYYNGPLIILRNVFFFVYNIYLIIVILTWAMRREDKLPWKNMLVGFIVLTFFAFVNFYSYLFAGDEARSYNTLFPSLALGIAIFIMFSGMWYMELLIVRLNHFEAMTNELGSELYYDVELGIRNRIAFKRDLKARLDKAGDGGEECCLVYIDIDDFGFINESYGEGFGNDILVDLVKRLMVTFGNAGTLYRIGGDEFAFLLKGMGTRNEAGNFASQIMSSLKHPFTVSGISYTVTVSMAILFIPRDGNDITTIMNNAYSTLANVKKIKNSYEFFSRDILDGASSRIYTVDLLRNCIARDEFVLVYQPIVDAGGSFAYAEALLRCTNGDPAIGGPGNFIPLVEKAGMMKDLDNLVVRRSFYDIEMKMKKRFSISINLSAGQLTDPSYGDFLSQFAKQHGIEPRHCILEITESSLVENMSLARKSLAELKKNGFMIAIDDFGKGFSSLSYLTELPVDIIKIDMAFVHAVPGDEKKETMAKYIMDLGHSLNMKVVAEGFELPEQVDFFKKLGCDLFQGYYFSRPMSLQDLLAKY